MAKEDISRRQFLGRAAAAGLGLWALGNGAFSCQHGRHRPIAGQLLGPDMTGGHRLRDGKLPAANHVQQVTTDIVIVGGGIAGLACAWRLRQSGFTNYILLEMEAECGGNARGGSQEGLRHPWGAHYLPVPDPANLPLQQFLQEAGVITGFDRDHRPIYNELYLCHAPHEQLQIHGTWQNGLVPHLGVPPAELAQIHRFFQAIERWKQTRGADGKPAFAIPAELSSQDPAFLELDNWTMALYLLHEGYDSEHLYWYIDYCCRDDYGTSAQECSAWAGLHYFAARAGGGANAESGDVLTWPEGNAWLAQQLRGKMVSGQQWLPRTMATSVANDGDGVVVQATDLGQSGVALRIAARRAVFAGPQMVAKHVVQAFPQDRATDNYAPWLVANLRVDLKGFPALQKRAWDNVAYGRASLGYVSAGHQTLSQYPPAEGIFTWYQPITDQSPTAARKWLQAQDYATLQQIVLDDMEFMHPGISDHVLQLDVWRWGHGMVRPIHGIIWGEALREKRLPIGHIYFAHSDLSGFSIFEEAFHRGIVAADAVLASLPA